MKITVIDAIGICGKPGIKKEIKSTEIEIPKNSRITDIWEQAKKAIKNAYTASNIVNFEGIQYRTHIGFKAHTIPKYLS